MHLPSRPTVLTPNIFLRKEGAYVFECPRCRKHFSYDDEYEPMCTGPSESRDEHEPTVMTRLGPLALPI